MVVLELFLWFSLCMSEKFIAYQRVSTKSQGDSGNGLNAQVQLNEEYAKSVSGEIVASFTDVESGKKDERSNLLLAIEEVKKVRGVLLVAKLDRLSRRCSLLFMLRESGIDIRVAERPSMSKLEFGILAILAEQERDFISTRTKQGLEQVKKRGIKLGNPKWKESIGKAIDANRQKAGDHRAKIIDEVEVLRRHGLKTLKELANGLNYRGITTRTGGKWYPMTVKRVLDAKAA
jgi:DNA invertase Pin-like site-specific DNA recombinase